MKLVPVIKSISDLELGLPFRLGIEKLVGPTPRPGGYFPEPDVYTSICSCQRRIPR